MTHARDQFTAVIPNNNKQIRQGKISFWSSFEILTLENTIKTLWTKYEKKIAQKI